MHCCHPSCESFFHQKPVLSVLFNPFRRLQSGLQGLYSKAVLCTLPVHCHAAPGSKSCFHMQQPALKGTSNSPKSLGVITRSEALPHAVLPLGGSFLYAWVYWSPQWRWWWRSAAFPTQQCREVSPALSDSRWWNDSWCSFPTIYSFLPLLDFVPSHEGLCACAGTFALLTFLQLCLPLKHLQWLCYMRHWAPFQV